MSRVEREDVSVETIPRHVGGQRGAGGDWRADESHRRAAVAGHLRRLVSRGRHLLAAVAAAAHACNATQRSIHEFLSMNRAPPNGAKNGGKTSFK